MEKSIKSGTTSIRVSNNLIKKNNPHWISPLGVFFILSWDDLVCQRLVVLVLLQLLLLEHL